MWTRPFGVHGNCPGRALQLGHLAVSFPFARAAQKLTKKRHLDVNSNVLTNLGMISSHFFLKGELKVTKPVGIHNWWSWFQVPMQSQARQPAAAGKQRCRDVTRCFEPGSVKVSWVFW